MNEETLLPSPNWYLSNVLACSVDGSFAYGSRNNIVIVRHLLGNSKSELPKISIIQNAHLERVTVVAFSRSRNSDDKYWNCLASAGDDSTIRLWNLNTLMPLYAHNSHVEGMKICCMDWSVLDSNLIVSADDSGSIVCWDLFSNTTQKLSLGKLVPTCLACCPHRRDLVALGTRSGLICTVSLKGGGKMLHRLRGHDAEVVSLAWCPVSYNVLQQKEDQQDILLASGAKEKTIYIWRVGGDGRYETVLNLPASPLIQNTGGVQQHRSRLSSSSTGGGSGGTWICVSWPEASTILSSSLWGELVAFNLKQCLDVRSSKQSTGKMWQLVHAHHIRGLFSIACTPSCEFIQNKESHEETKSINGAESNDLITKEHGDTMVESSGQSQVVLTTAQDRQLIACYWKTGEVIVNVPTLGGFVYCIATSPLDSNRIAFGVGDATIRVWNLSNSTSVDVTSFWQKIKGKVMALAWHPEKEGWLAYGTSEGRVGLNDVSSGKQPVLFRPYHRRNVYTLCWGPAVYKQGDEAISGTFLYSCGDGHIVRYNVNNPNEEPYNLKDMLQTSDINLKKEIIRTEMAWKPDNTMLAIGNEDGTVHILSTPHLMLVHVLFAHKKLIQCIVWHPESTATDTGYSPYQHWLAVSSNEAHIKVYDLSPLMKGDVETESNQLIPVQNCITLSGHLNRVVSMCWSPHIGGLLVSVSFDNTAQVWNVCTQQPIANFCSHANHVLCCVWSPFDPDLIITGSADFTLRVWRVSSQIQTLPSDRKKLKKIELKKIKASSATEVKSLLPVKGDDTSVPGVLNEDPSEVEYARSEKEACEAGVSDEITKKKKKKTFTRKSFFPVSSQHQKHGIEQHFKNCCHLLAAFNKNSTQIEEVGDIPSGDFPSYLGFFSNQDAMQRLLDVEVEHHINGENFEMAQNIELWRGNVTEMLKEALRRKQLSDWLVSLAPMASQRLWMDLCKAYSEQLVVCEQYHKAASYLLACHRVNEAIDLLVNHHLFREALAIARSRLGPDDPTPKKIICAWGRQVASEGNYELAAECLISVGELLEAAMLIRKRNDEGSLKLAALIADKAGAQDLAAMLANQSIKQCLFAGKWDVASDLVKQHSHLKHLGLLLTIRQTLAELAAVSDSSMYVKWLHNCSIFPFEHTPLIEVILSRWKSDFNDEEAQKMCTTLLNEFSQNEAPDTTEKLWFAVSVELAIACVNNGIKRLKHMVLALGMCYHYRQLQPSAGYLLLQLCVWITPKGPFAEMSPFCTTNSDEGIITSLQAYLCAGIVDWIVDHGETQSHEVNDNSELSTKDVDVVDSVDANNEKQETCASCGKHSERWYDFLKVFQICITAIVAKESLQYFQDCVKIKKWEHEIAIAFAKSRKQVQIADAGEKEDDISLSPENISDNSETESMLHRLKELKERKQVFEEKFISTPNPFVTYCKIKNLFHIQKEDSFSSDLCEQFESLWKTATLHS